MPRRKKSTYNYRRKRKYQTRYRYRRRYRKGATVNTMRGRNGIPDKVRNVLTFIDDFAITATPSSYNVYRGNGAYDPDTTLGGESAAEFNTWSILYNTHTVLASKITLTIMNNSTSSSCIVGCWPSITAIGGAYDLGDVYAQPHVKYAIMPVAPSSDVRYIRNYMGTKRIYGRHVREQLDEDFSSTGGNVPLNQWYWNISSTSLGGGTAQLNTRIIVQIKYYMEWTNYTKSEQN